MSTKVITHFGSDKKYSVKSTTYGVKFKSGIKREFLGGGGDSNSSLTHTSVSPIPPLSNKKARAVYAYGQELPPLDPATRQAFAEYFACHPLCRVGER